MRIEYTEDAISVLRDIRKSIVFYEHIDKKYYDQYKSCVQDIEDYLVEVDCVESDSAYVDYYNELAKRLNDLYSLTARKLF